MVLVNNQTDKPVQTLDQLIQARKYTIQRIKKRNRKKVLFDKEYRFLSFMNEPRNRYDIFCKLCINNDVMETTLSYYLTKGLIKQTEHNPNKFIITPKGKLLLFKICEINQYIYPDTKKEMAEMIL